MYAWGARMARRTVPVFWTSPVIACGWSSAGAAERGRRCTAVYYRDRAPALLLLTGPLGVKNESKMRERVLFNQKSTKE